MNANNIARYTNTSKDARHLVLRRWATFCCLSTLVALGTGCATPQAKRPTAPVATIQVLESKEVSRSAMNPYQRFSPAAEMLKFPPSAGAGAYWGDGRFNITLNNFYDEQEGPTCLLEQIICFRQEGERVYATGKQGCLVLDLAGGTYKKESSVDAFEPGDQAALKKLFNKEKDNIYFNAETKMPDQ